MRKIKKCEKSAKKNQGARERKSAYADSSILYKIATTWMVNHLPTPSPDQVKDTATIVKV
jgi:hypothetical protein